MKYDDYLPTVSKAFDAAFAEIDAKLGFDYGDEFEVSLAKTLRRMLPARFGVCRGFVVCEDGTLAGDDVIVYDRHNFPLLRVLEDDSFEKKQNVPVEAVYAYLEAKHTLVIEGNGSTSLAHAEEQVRRVQKLDGVERSEPLMDCYRAGVNEACFDRSTTPWGRSPIFGAVVSRFAKIKDSDMEPATPEAVREAMSEGYAKDKGEGYFITDEDFGFYPTESEVVGHQVDLVVAGRSNILLPFEIIDRTKPRLVSPYSVPDRTRLCHAVCPDMSFAMGMCSLLWALEMAHLGRMPWPILLADALVATKPTAQNKTTEK